MRITLKPRGNKIKDLDKIDFNSITELEVISKSMTSLPENIITPNIKKIEIICPKLKDLPSNFYTMKQLEFLRIKNAPEFQLDESLTFSKLKHIHLSGLKLNSFPKFVKDSALVIETLDLHANEIEEVPNYLSGMENLKRLNLDKNKISKFILSSEGLKNLVYLSLENNQLDEDEIKRIESVFKVICNWAS